MILIGNPSCADMTESAWSFRHQIPAGLRHVTKILDDFRMFPGQRFRLSGFRTVAGDDIPYSPAFGRQLEHRFGTNPPTLALSNAADMAHPEFAFTIPSRCTQRAVRLQLRWE
jgi:hypothetical protein